MYEILYSFVPVSAIYFCITTLIAQSSTCFAAHASVGQEFGQGSAGMAHLCFICCQLQWEGRLGSQMASHSCFINFYFGLAFVFSSFTVLFKISAPKTTEMAFIEIQRIEVYVRASEATSPRVGCAITIKA